MRKSGFTMIEFLVVAALIGILATLGMGAYSRSLSRGRDAKRIADMKEIQKMFETYYSLHGAYGDNCDEMFGPQTGTKPSPPAGNISYVSRCDATGYLYCSGLENGADYGNATCSNPNDIATCSFGGPNINSYCVSNVQ